MTSRATIVASVSRVLGIRRLLLLLCCWRRSDTFLPVVEGRLRSTAPAFANAETVELHDEVDRAVPGFFQSSLLEKMDACRFGPTLVCDPDHVLAPAAVARIDHTLDDKGGDQKLSPRSDRVLPMIIPCGDQTMGVQVAVAIVAKMDLTAQQSDKDVVNAAETFARALHDRWGIGFDSECGGSGALLLFSVQDRAMFISRGRALERYLTNSRLDSILDAMKPLLRRQEYGAAIVRGLEEVQGYIQMGEPGYWEVLQDHSGIIMFVAFFGFLGWIGRRAEAQHRLFDELTSQLSELDRARAEALQGKYQATSCPICLECFPVPVIRESETNAIADDARKEVRRGSDGKPIMLLRCGHCFDDSCFAEWIRTGNGQVDKCPICKTPVGAEGGVGCHTPERTDIGHDAELRRRGVAGGGSDSSTAPLGFSGTSSTVSRTDHAAASMRMRFDPVAAFGIYNEERIFRLGRIHSRYPQFVRAREIRRWSRPNYNGLLAQDSAVLARDPFPAYSTSSPDTFFGGGMSSGGRGGLW